MYSPPSYNSLDATIYVGGLDDKVTETLLWELFLQAGPVGTLVRRCTVECVFVLLLECGLPDFNAACSHTVGVWGMRGVPQDQLMTL